MNTQTKNENANGSGLLSHPEQVSGQGAAKHGSVYEQITERIIAMLEKGTIPWKMNWKTKSAWPCNLVSKRPYQGMNVFLLHAMSYESPFWLTYRQALELGGNVRKGEKACPVIFCKRFDVVDEKTGEVEKVPMLRFYYCFNSCQCEGLKNLADPVEVITTTKPAEIIANMPQCPEIKHGMREAFYSPAEDIIAMPDMARFDREENFYSTLYHSLRLRLMSHPYHQTLWDIDSFACTKALRTFRVWHNLPGPLLLRGQKATRASPTARD